ncbi:MAG: glycosyltransferase family 4 protein [Bacteroidota bacterium]
MKLLVLYAELMPYNMACFKSLVNNWEATIHVVRWDKKVLTPYQPENIDGVTYYNRSAFSLEQIKSLYNTIQPDAIFVSGWMDKDYLKICKIAKLNKVPVITSADSQWTGSIKQRLGAISAKFYFKKLFDYIMIPGAYQFEFAKRIGFKNNQILFNLYAGDVSFYSKLYQEHLPQKTNQYPKNILFLGRFADVKNCRLLIDAFTELTHPQKAAWKIYFIGNGPLEKDIPVNDNFKIYPFMPPLELAKVLPEIGLFCLPSKKEPWGVVVHEMAAYGLPLLISNACGAATAFVKNAYNGFTFQSENKASLQFQLLQLFNKTDDELLAMGKKSNQLAKQILPDIWASEMVHIMQTKINHTTEQA